VGEPPDELPRWARRLADEPERVIPLEPMAGEPLADPDWPDREPPKCGILNVDKPMGLTSHDVVAAVRKASGVRRVGHAGTLDPLATGVLVVCIGSATRVIDHIQFGSKAYRARARLGVATTTYDAEGDIVEARDASGVTPADVERALAAYRGSFTQTPPMYSAIRHDGRRLYELARHGLEVERDARPVRVDRLELTEWEPPELTLEMTVSKGFYVRSLVHDLGRDLSVGAHVAALRRTAVGAFAIEDAVLLPRIVEAFVEGWWPRLVYPLDTALREYAALIVDQSADAAIRNGRQIEGPAPRAGHGDVVRAYSSDGVFIGLLRWDEVTVRWQPDRVFPSVT